MTGTIRQCPYCPEKFAVTIRSSFKHWLWAFIGVDSHRLDYAVHVADCKNRIVEEALQQAESKRLLQTSALGLPQPPRRSQL